MNSPAPSVRVTTIAFTGYPVTDIARSRAFYEKLLGLTPTMDFEHEGAHWIEYDIGPSTLAITNISPSWRPATDGPNVALEVADFDAAVAALRAGGVKFTVEPTATPACRLAVICDPDGNSLAIHRRNPETA